MFFFAKKKHTDTHLYGAKIRGKCAVIPKMICVDRRVSMEERKKWII
jgi:hypothetical protein